MRFFCPACGTAHEKPDADIPASGIEVACDKCGFNIQLKLPQGTPRTTGEDADAEGRGPLLKPPRHRTEPHPWLEQPPPAPESGTGEDQAFATPGAAEPPEALSDPFDRPVNRKRSGNSALARLRQALWTYPGTGKSGARFRFRDLFFALLAPLDLRKTLASSAGVFVGALLFAAIMWLAIQAENGTVVLIGTILGELFLFACMFLGVGAATRQADLEMKAGKRLPFSEGLDFVKHRGWVLVGTPALFLGAMVLLGLGILILTSISLIPVVGPILYGLLFFVTLLLAVAIVLLGVGLTLSVFSYIPAAEIMGPMEAARRVWRVIRNRPGPYLLHLLLASLTAAVLMLLLHWVLLQGLALVGWIGRQSGGGEFTNIFIAMPTALFGALAVAIPDKLMDLVAGALDTGWQFDLAGWLVAFTLLAAFSILVGFVLTYWFTAGVVNFHLCTQPEADEDAAKPAADSGASSPAAS